MEERAGVSVYLKRRSNPSMHVRTIVVASLVIVGVAYCAGLSDPALAQSCNATPTRPASAVAARVSDGSVLFAWTQSGGCAASKFYIEASRGTSEVIETTVEDATGRSAMLTLGANNGTPWRINVRAFNAYGLSAGRSAILNEGRDPSQPPPTNECAGSPFPPTLISANAAGQTLYLQWQAPAQCAVAATGFTLIGQSAPGGPVLGTVTIPYPTYSWSGQVPPGSYYVSVATNYYGSTSAPSNAIFVHVP